MDHDDTIGLARVRNMGNFNFSLTHVLTIFHHVEQYHYPSFLLIPISQP